MRVFLIPLSLCLFAAPVRAADAFLAAEGVPAKELAGALPADAGAAAWDAVPPTTVAVSSQRSIHLNDRVANAALDGAARAVTVRAVYNAHDVALLVEWSDDTEDRARHDETNVFGDSVALELPLRFGAGVRLPYIGMGDDAEHVALYHARAGEKETIAREAVAAGFGSSTRADLGSARVDMRYDAAHKRWRAMFVRPLATPGNDLRRGLVPFAVAVWDGGKHERGGNKALSSWKLLRLSRYPLDVKYERELSYGFLPEDAGDPARGKVLVEAVCASCHFVGDKRIAPPGVAPDLSDIGAIALPVYLRDSVVTPSAVIVPNPNMNQHYDRGAKPDAYGAYPNNELFVWYTRDAKGNKVSKMPPFAFPKPDIAAIVAYLRTLGVAPAATQARRSP